MMIFSKTPYVADIAADRDAGVDAGDGRAGFLSKSIGES
jgi:hypothetical protein